jgi:hypothetical protein
MRKLAHCPVTHEPVQPNIALSTDTLRIQEVVQLQWYIIHTYMYSSCTYIVTLVFLEVFIRTNSIHDVVRVREEIYTLARTTCTPQSGFCSLTSTKHIKNQCRIKESQILELKW